MLLYIAAKPIQHDSLAHKDGMRSTQDTWQLNYSIPALRNKTQSVWIKTPYQYQGAVQVQTLRLSTQCTSAAMDCLVLRTLREGPSRVPSAPSNIESLTNIRPLTGVDASHGLTRRWGSVWDSTTTNKLPSISSL